MLVEKNFDSSQNSMKYLLVKILFLGQRVVAWVSSGQDTKVALRSKMKAGRHFGGMYYS